MVLSMVNKPKTLIVVEGEHLEPCFFEQIKKAFGLSLDIYCLNCNIYRLYNKMKRIGFNANLKDILLGFHDTMDVRELLSQDFAYTYLIFDFDPHHTEKDEKSISLETIVANNIAKIKEMAKYFIDETDPTIGKLYINYPMMESFKDCDSFNDENYLTRMVSLDDIKRYKLIVGQRKMANKRVDTYGISDFSKLARQNVKKLEKLCLSTTSSITYSDYIREAQQSNILLHEIEFVRNLKVVSVLNTSAFFAIDYYGNRDGFFDATMRE